MSLLIRNAALAEEEEHEVQEEVQRELEASEVITASPAQVREVSKLVSSKFKQSKLQKDGLLKRLRKLIPSEVCPFIQQSQCRSTIVAWTYGQ